MKVTLIFCGLLAVGVATALFAGPPKQSEKSSPLANAVILIIRHGEKPDAGDQLSAAGQARAQAYADFFKNFTLNGQPLKLDSLFAAADSKVSQRPRLTIEPTSKLLGLPIDTQFADPQYQSLANELRSQPHGPNILICWHHEEIPQLVQALGADPGRLFPKGKWPDDVFNWVVELRYDSEGLLSAAQRSSERF